MTKRLRPRRADTCDGGGLKAALLAATAWLEQNADKINALNVFPVPDGDTGSNMWLTLQSAVAEANGTPATAGAGAVARAAAHGALMGARGNSGVILSQILRGIARGLDEKASFASQDLAAALADGAATAYRGVIKPVEGTILTVARESAETAQRAASEGVDMEGLLVRVVASARESLARTPSLLPVLAEAGVVDAGGQGYLAFLEGLLKHFGGDESAVGAEREPKASRPTVHEGQYGYCTEFLLRGDSINVEALRETIAAQGESALVVGDASLARVHLHTFDPGRVLSEAARYGSLHKIKIDNMAEQHHEYLLANELRQQEAPASAVRPPSPAVGDRLWTRNVVPDSDLSLVVVASGAGCTQLFRSLGAEVVVPGGQTMNPSTRELLEAVESASTNTVILLPNNRNIVTTAQQAVDMSSKRVAVISTLTVPQGVAAMMAYNYEATLENNMRAMRHAIERVRTVEVTRAVRAAKVDGLQVEVGAAIALVDGKLVASETDLAAAALAAMPQANLQTAELVTIIYGEATTQTEAEALAGSVRERWPSLSVEVVDGGQPHYPYIISIE